MLVWMCDIAWPHINKGVFNYFAFTCHIGPEVIISYDRIKLRHDETAYPEI